MDLNRDGDGFLVNTNDWSEEVMNQMADADGFVFASNVNEVTEMVEMMAAGRSYQNNVEVVNTAKQLMNRTLDLTKV